MEEPDGRRSDGTEMVTLDYSYLTSVLLGQVAPNLAYSDPEMAEIALRNIKRRTKRKVTRPEIKVGDMVWIRVKPIESRGSYRVNKIAGAKRYTG